jgi:hypothetical protein
MSKQNLERILKNELEILNDVIDHKIIKGLSYSREAKRHKFISSRLVEIKRESRRASNWFGRAFSTV